MWRVDVNVDVQRSTVEFSFNIAMVFVKSSSITLYWQLDSPNVKRLFDNCSIRVYVYDYWTLSSTYKQYPVISVCMLFASLLPNRFNATFLIHSHTHSSQFPLLSENNNNNPNSNFTPFWLKSHHTKHHTTHSKREWSETWLPRLLPPLAETF